MRSQPGLAQTGIAQTGIALISAMLIAALVTAGAVALATSQTFGTRRVANVLSADRALLAVDELEAQASNALKNDSQRGQYDALSEAWAKAEFTVTQSDLVATAELRDLQGKFNLTNLSAEPLFHEGEETAAAPTEGSTEAPATPPTTPVTAAPPTPDDPAQANPGEQQLRMLFKALALDANAVQAILDWVDSDTETRFPNGAEDDYYTEQTPAYRAANRPFTTPRELLLVKGITLAIYQKLAPFVVCLPQTSRINVNTADKEVLMSLAPGIDSAAAETIMRARDTQPFLTPDMFLKHPLLQFRQISPEMVTTTSEYFELRSVASNDRIDIAIDSRLKRNGDKVVSVDRHRHNFDP